MIDRWTLRSRGEREIEIEEERETHTHTHTKRGNLREIERKSSRKSQGTRTQFNELLSLESKTWKKNLQTHGRSKTIELALNRQREEPAHRTKYRL